jgi:large subunit ribosomal protein L9
MRVVFLQDVPRVAKACEVKEVADGYARNFLIPRKLALLARPEVLSQLGTAQKVEAKEDAELMALAQQIEGKEVSIKAKAGAKDRLYGSITSADIAAELSKSSGLVIDKRKIELEEPLRSLGNYEITIRLAKDIVPKIKVSVTEEEAKAEEKPPKKKAAKKKVAEKPPKAEKAEKKPPKKKAVKPKPPKPKKEEKAKKEKKVTPKKTKKTPEKEEG